VRAHQGGRDDEWVRVAPLQGRVGRFTGLIVPGAEPEAFAALRPADGTGRPFGSDALLARFERRLGRPARPQKPGRKPAAHGNETGSDRRSR
jgi:putative transposase